MLNVVCVVMQLCRFGLIDLSHCNERSDKQFDGMCRRSWWQPFEADFNSVEMWRGLLVQRHTIGLCSMGNLPTLISGT